MGIYDRLSRYEAEKGVCIAFGTMYGNTEKAARELSAELTVLGVPNVVHDLRVENPSAAIRDVFKYDTLILGSPTYNGGIFPPVEAFMKAVSARGVKNRKFFAFGSYTWAAASVRLLLEQATIRKRATVQSHSLLLRTRRRPCFPAGLFNSEV